MTDLYRKINKIAVIAGGAECDPSPEQAEADLKYICAAVSHLHVMRDIVRAAKSEQVRAYAALHARIRCHAECVERDDTGRCVAKDALMRCCSDRDARMAMGERVNE